MVAQRPGEPGIPAFVTKVKNNAVSAVAIMTGPGGGLIRFQTCYHRDDPDCVLKPGIFESQNNGVFWLSDLEMERRASVEKMRILERSVGQQLTAMNSLLEEIVDRLSKVESKRAQKQVA
jgi:hypothetical protein